MRLTRCKLLHSPFDKLYCLATQLFFFKASGSIHAALYGWPSKTRRCKAELRSKTEWFSITACLKGFTMATPHGPSAWRKCFKSVIVRVITIHGWIEAVKLWGVFFSPPWTLYDRWQAIKQSKTVFFPQKITEKNVWKHNQSKSSIIHCNTIARRTAQSKKKTLTKQKTAPSTFTVSGAPSVRTVSQEGCCCWRLHLPWCLLKISPSLFSSVFLSTIFPQLSIFGHEHPISYSVSSCESCLPPKALTHPPIKLQETAIMGHWSPLSLHEA